MIEYFQNMRSIFIVSFCILTVMISGAGFADAPKIIEAKLYGPRMDILVHHPTINGLLHYVNRILVKQNGKNIIQQNFPTQYGSIQRAIYLIPLVKPDDRFEITAFSTPEGSLTVVISPEAKR